MQKEEYAKLWLSEVAQTFFDVYENYKSQAIKLGISKESFTSALKLKLQEENAEL